MDLGLLFRMRLVLTGISPELYESAAIDGASRWKQTWYITLPSLTNTIVLLTVLALGNVLNAGFDQVFNMYNPMVYGTVDILDTWVYRMGLTKLQFSLATAAGLFKEPLINHRYFITIDKSVRESSLSRAFSGFGFPVIRS